MEYFSQERKVKTKKKKTKILAWVMKTEGKGDF